MGLVQIKNVV